MEIDPRQIPQRDRYKLLTGAIVPRPIAFVSTVSPDGRTNLAPFSFFAGVSSEPMSLLFCPANKPDGCEKDTLRNVLLGATPGDALLGGGEFVVNVVSMDIARPMVICAEELPYGESEFGISGLTPSPSNQVRPPRVLESMVSFECRAMQVIRLAVGIGGGGNIVLGRIVWIHAADRVIDDRFHIEAGALDATGRMMGLAYCSTRDRFELPMGRG